MSVYYEAVVSGRLTPTDVANAGGSVRRALREVKRREAEDRNEHTPHERTRRHRRELDAAAQRTAGKKGGRRG